MQVLAHNLAAQFTNRQLNITTDKKAKSSEKLSSGYKINRSADDAAGLQISEKMRWQIRGLDQASENIQDGISLCQVADGALNESHAVLQRMRELSVQAANDTNSDEDREAIQQEIDQLTKEVDRIANDTSFNSEIYPLKGSGNGGNASFSGWQLPAYLSIHEITLTNTTSSAIVWDDVTYKPGEKFKSSYILYDAAKNSGSSWKKYNYAIKIGGGVSSGSETDIGKIEERLLENAQKHGGYSITGWEVEDDGVIYFRTADFFSDPKGKKIYYAVSNDGNQETTGTERSKYVDYYFKAIKNANAQGVGNNNIWIQMGAQKDQGMFLELVNATAKGVGITDPALDVTDFDKAGASIDRLDAAISKVSSYRSSFGAQQNRLEYGKKVNDNTAENTQKAESLIRDTDMAEEMVNYSKNNILEQAGQALLAQANQSVQGILQLLQQ